MFNIEIIKYIYPYIKKHKWKFSFLVTLNIFSFFVAMLIPTLGGKYVDLLNKLTSVNTIIRFSVYMFLLLFFDIILNFIKRITLIKLGANISFDINYDVIDHIKKLPLKELNSYDSVYLNQRINSDANILASFALEKCVNTVFQVFYFLGSVIILFRVSLQITLVLLAVIPFFIVNYIYFRKKLYSTNKLMKESGNKFFSDMNEQLFNIKLIKTNSWFNILGNKLKKSYNYFYNDLIKHHKLTYAFSGLGSIGSNTGKVIVFLIGGIQVISGKITIGDFTMINSYFVKILGAVQTFLGFGVSYQDTLVSYNRLLELLNKQKEHNGVEYLDSIDTIEVKNACFNYDNESEIISNFNYTFEKGKVYTILGDNGTGKSTLLSLILGLYIDDYKGNITYNNKDIKDLDLYEIRKNFFGVTEQEPMLFKGSILSNITFGLDNVDSDFITKICSILSIDSFINKHGQGLDLELEERSKNISGGEKQKLSLIRTFIKEASVLLLDEPISALDSTSILLLKNYIQEIKHNKIIIIITHNLEILDISDEVIDLNKLKEKRLSLAQ